MRWADNVKKHSVVTINSGKVLEGPMSKNGPKKIL